MDQTVVPSRPTFFSIVLPVCPYHVDLLPKAVDSVLRQTQTDWQLLIVADDCYEQVRSLLADHIDHRISLHATDLGGVSEARNLGIAVASGQYVGFLDADDHYLPNHLAALARAIGQGFYRGGKVFRTGMIHEVAGRHKHTGLYSKLSHGHPVLFALTTFWGINSICVESRVAKDHRFHAGFRYFEDTEWLVRLLLQHDLVQINEYTCVALAHAAQSSDLMYHRKDYLLHLGNHVEAIRHLFEQHRVELDRIVPPGLERGLICDKLIQQANGLLIHGRPIAAIRRMWQSVRLSTRFRNWGLYLRFLLKWPLLSLFSRLLMKRQVVT